MGAEESLKAGQPGAALAQLQEQVRARPADAKLRTFLFQLLAVTGQWSRAMNQLKVAGELDASTLLMVQMYQNALECESVRADVFAGKRTPLFFGEPEAWVANVFQSLKVAAAGQHAQAQSLREQAFESIPATRGKIDDKPFEWIADADSRMGPCLEVMLAHGYFWVPFHRIKEIRLDPPEDLRDMVWAPVQLTWSNGGQAVGLVPTRYPGSESASDGALQLARRTEWVEVAPGVFNGLGQRLLATDADEYPLLQARVITLETAG